MSASFTTSSKLSWVNTSVASGGGVQLGSETSLTLATIAETEFKNPISKFALSYQQHIECKTWYQELQIRVASNVFDQSLHTNTPNHAPLCFTSLLPRRSSRHLTEHLTYAEHRSVPCSTIAHRIVSQDRLKRLFFHSD